MKLAVRILLLFAVFFSLTACSITVNGCQGAVATDGGTVTQTQARDIETGMEDADWVFILVLIMAAICMLCIMIAASKTGMGPM